MSNRSLRRHHVRRIKKKVARLNWVDSCVAETRPEGRGRLIGRMASSRAACSCWMCGNPRRHHGERTRKELLHILGLHDKA